MKSLTLRKRFSQIQENNPIWGSIPCFIFATEGKEYSRQKLAYYFKRLIKKDEYASDEKKAILADIYRRQASFL